MEFFTARLANINTKHFICQKKKVEKGSKERERLFDSKSLLWGDVEYVAIMCGFFLHPETPLKKHTQVISATLNVKCMYSGEK